VQAVDGGLQKVAVEHVPLVHTPVQHTPPLLVLQLLPEFMQMLPGPPSLFPPSFPASLLLSGVLPVEWLQLQPATVQVAAKARKITSVSLFITTPARKWVRIRNTPCTQGALKESILIPMEPPDMTRMARVNDIGPLRRRGCFAWGQTDLLRRN